MFFELTRREIREALNDLKVSGECQFPVDDARRVRQTISEIHAYTNLQFETSTKNKQLPDKIIVRRLR